MRIFIDVHTSGNGKRYEIMLDDRSTVEAATKHIIDEITRFEDNQISFDTQAVLCDITKGERLPGYMNLRIAGVKSGHTLMLL